MVDKRISLILSILVFAALSLSACGKKEGDEPTKYRSQAGLEKLTQQAQQRASKAAQQGGTSLKSASVNPAFYAVADSTGKAPEVKDLDSAFRPVLQKLFGGVKIVSESRTPETKVDGEVVENRFAYVVSRVLTADDGDTLHAALCAEHFSSSPRLGSKPTKWSGGAAMSLFKNTSLRSYSLVVNVDTRKQLIVIESYRLGSKYDRLM